MTGKHIFHEDFRLRPFWWEAAPPLSRAAALPDAVDVAVVGGGYAGLSAALHLARGGARVVVLEAGEFGAGASSRNAGLVSGGNYLGKGLKGLSDDEAAALMREASGALDLVEEIVAAERIDCGYERSGRVVAAAVPAHYAALEATLDRLNRHADARASMLPRDRQREEIASDAYGGGMIVRRTGKLHPALYLHGLLAAAERAGAVLCSGTAVQAIEGARGAFALRAGAGTLRAGEVVIATNGYTGTLTPALRRRVVPVGSYMIATEPLPQDLAASLLPTGRTLTDTRRVLRFARMSPDGTRMLFGGRAKLTPQAPEKAAPVLHRFMCEIFPQLRGSRITHAWCGNVAFTFDFLPHAGLCGGLHYCLGCNGSGVAMMTMLGRNVAARILGAGSAGAFERPSFPTRPLYAGDPRPFLPLVGGLYRFQDWLDRIRAG
ncbi:MAG: FAD-dependent oxidoreductase [Hyphomicrobiales bacterium]|nr:MAG: FAD-dependent oxidoreductase [Hyphomicrobiales bacterium]